MRQLLSTVLQNRTWMGSGPTKNSYLNNKISTLQASEPSTLSSLTPHNCFNNLPNSRHSMSWRLPATATFNSLRQWTNSMDQKRPKINSKIWIVPSKEVWINRI